MAQKVRKANYQTERPSTDGEEAMGDCPKAKERLVLVGRRNSP